MAGLGLAAAWVEVSSLGFSPHQATPRSENLNCCVNGEGTRWTRWVDWEQTELSYYRQPGACGQGHSLHPPASAYGNKKWASLYHFLSLVRMGVANVCKYPINIGPCAEWTQHWFYNWKTSDCESLNFGGCYGNGNNFEKKTECEETCKKPDFLISQPSLEPGLL